MFVYFEYLFQIWHHVLHISGHYLSKYYSELSCMLSDNFVLGYPCPASGILAQIYSVNKSYNYIKNNWKINTIQMHIWKLLFIKFIKERLGQLHDEFSWPMKSATHFLWLIFIYLIWKLCSKVTERLSAASPEMKVKYVEV